MHMFGPIIKMRMFASSYAPFFLALACRFTSTWYVLACLAIAIWGLVDTLYLVKYLPRRLAKTPVEFDHIDDAGIEASGYLATYILPFIMASQPTYREMAAYFIFIVVTALIYISSNMMKINPVLYLLGYSVVIGSWRGELNYVITRRSLQTNTPYRMIKVGTRIMVYQE